jgi:hypothetical protein
MNATHANHTPENAARTVRTIPRAPEALVDVRAVAEYLSVDASWV